MLTLADLATRAVGYLEQAGRAVDRSDFDEAQTWALLSIAASLYRLQAVPGRDELDRLLVDPTREGARSRVTIDPLDRDPVDTPSAAEDYFDNDYDPSHRQPREYRDRD